MTRKPIRVGLPSALALAWITAASPAGAADPTTADCLTANNSSIDLRNSHRLREARAQLLVCGATSCPSDIRKECLQHVDEVNAQIPTIIFEVKDASGRDLSAVKVTMDGQPLVDRLEGTALSVDPGEHTFLFETAGQPPVTKQLVLREAQKERHEAVTFGAAGATPPPQPEQPLLPAAQTPRSPWRAPQVPQTSGARLGLQRTVGLVSAGVGVVGLVVGSVFGAMVLSKKSDAQNACPNACSNQHGVDLWNDAASSGNLATAFFVVGAVGIAAGATLWFTAPSSGSAPKAQVGIGPGALRLKGTW